MIRQRNREARLGLYKIEQITISRSWKDQQITLLGTVYLALIHEHGARLCATPELWRRSMPTKTTEKKASRMRCRSHYSPRQDWPRWSAQVPRPRGQVVSKIWEYIRSHNLQNPENRREILADNKLRKVFGKYKVTMFEMSKHLTRYLK
jgi:hypothetical protein